MTLAYTIKLGFSNRKTSVGAQKIDSLLLETYCIVSASFSLLDDLERVWFFEKTFLLVNTSMKVVLKMLFLSLRNANIEFVELGKLIWRFYIITEILPTTSWIKLIDKREFAKTALDGSSKTFVMYVAALEILTAISIYPFRAF